MKFSALGVQIHFWFTLKQCISLNFDEGFTGGIDPFEAELWEIIYSRDRLCSDSDNDLCAATYMVLILKATFSWWKSTDVQGWGCLKNISNTAVTWQRNFTRAINPISQRVE